MKTVNVIGMGLSPDDLTEKHLRFIRDADVIVGGRRHLACFDELPAEKVAITKKIKALAEEIKELAETKSVVVLASGDPLYYGIGSTLITCFGRENINIHPNITSVSGAFARVGESWHDADVVSLHGRAMDGSIGEIFSNKDKIAVFTDPTNNPAKLASILLESGQSDFRICVLENMGTADEKVGWYGLEEAAGISFSDPNMVVLKRRSVEKGPQVDKLTPAMPDDNFFHQRGLITKPEVRSVSLSKLRLESWHVMWDLGAGSGSVSVEASLYIKTGTVYAVEQKEERIGDIKKNRDKFQVRNLEIIHRTLPEGLDELPAPDRIFIGGGGKNLGYIIRSACKYLKKDGRIVINTVLLKNIDVVVTALEELGFDVDIVNLQVSSNHNMPWDQMMKAQNPVWIITGGLMQG